MSFVLPGVIISDNEIQFTTTTNTDFFHELGVQKKLCLCRQPIGNEQEKSVNKVILKGIKKNLDGSKGFWVE